MKILCDAGLVNARKEGKNTYYSVSKEAAAELEKGFAMVLEDLK